MAKSNKSVEKILEESSSYTNSGSIEERRKNESTLFAWVIVLSVGISSWPVAFFEYPLTTLLVTAVGVLVVAKHFGTYGD
jgi:hypothetical protein